MALILDMFRFCTTYSLLLLADQAVTKLYRPAAFISMTYRLETPQKTRESIYDILLNGTCSRDKVLLLDMRV
jgi:hypothetical protein